MGRYLTAALGGVFLVAGVGGVIVFLTSEGLDRAEKWISISVGIGSLLLGAFGAVLAWKSWRHSIATTTAGTPPPHGHPQPGGVPQAGGTAPAAPVSPEGINLSNAKGVQIGDHNTQNNKF
ncbi:RIP homotypic interaction motif-containing protein [Actinoplanes sp. NPDC051861]|uniref:RIP homotypic interaction motif-containing protein n=1 Tax=Actinoplanes sp. NPDC051861 TaxID=3155170 RepID=UPI003433C630